MKKNYISPAVSAHQVGTCVPLATSLAIDQSGGKTIDPIDGVLPVDTKSQGESPWDEEW